MLSYDHCSCARGRSPFRSEKTAWGFLTESSRAAKRRRRTQAACYPYGCSFSGVARASPALRARASKSASGRPLFHRACQTICRRISRSPARSTGLLGLAAASRSAPCSSGLQLPRRRNRSLPACDSFNCRVKGEPREHREGTAGLPLSKQGRRRKRERQTNRRGGKERDKARGKRSSAGAPAPSSQMKGTSEAAAFSSSSLADSLPPSALRQRAQHINGNP